MAQLAGVCSSPTRTPPVVELRDALADRDAVAVAVAHSLRGASANIGATDLARLCAILETHGIAGDLGRGAGVFDAIGRARRVRGALEPAGHRQS